MVTQTDSLVRGDKAFIPRPDGKFATLPVVRLVISPDGRLSVPAKLLPGFSRYADGNPREDDTLIFEWWQHETVLRNLSLGSALCRVVNKATAADSDLPRHYTELLPVGEYWLHDYQDWLAEN